MLGLRAQREKGFTSGNWRLLEAAGGGGYELGVSGWEGQVSIALGVSSTYIAACHRLFGSFHLDMDSQEGKSGEDAEGGREGGEGRGGEGEGNEEGQLQGPPC